MEDRQPPGLWLEPSDLAPSAWAEGRAPVLAELDGVERVSWWENRHPDRDDLPRRLDEFATLGLAEVGEGFRPPEGVRGWWFGRTPRPGQGSLGGDATTGLLVVLISPKDPDGGQELRDWGDFVHLRHIAEAAVPGYRMITPYENAGGDEPRYLHLYEMHADDPEATYLSMTPRVRERLDPAAFEAWAWHPQLCIEYVNTFALVGATS